MQADRLLDVRHLKKYFRVRGGGLRGRHQFVRAVDDVSIHIDKSETLGIVGESGCGKTTLGRTVVRLYAPTSGEIVFDGRNIAGYTENEMLPVRRLMQMIYQDPYSSLNPRMTVAEIISEPMLIHKLGTRQEIRKRAMHLLEIVGLAAKHGNRYPHEFSGGQRQRVGIARTLAINPQLIVCDEPISALDVSIQAQIINLLQDLQSEFGLTYLFIAHDLSMVKYISNRICVMYLGNVVEIGPAEELYHNPQHPYTQALLSAVPIADPIRSEQRKRIILQGSVPSPIDPPSGCKFRTRCPFAMEKCSHVEPALVETSEGHEAACHLIARPEQ